MLREDPLATLQLLRKIQRCIVADGLTTTHFSRSFSRCVNCTPSSCNLLMILIAALKCCIDRPNNAKAWIQLKHSTSSIFVPYAHLARLSRGVVPRQRTCRQPSGSPQRLLHAATSTRGVARPFHLTNSAYGDALC